jgi:hypothetical protein
VLAAVVVVILLLRSSTRVSGEQRADFELKSGLYRELSRLRGDPSAPSWPAPKLPYSVIASIWTGRLAAVATSLPPGTRRIPNYSLAWSTWKYRREAPYIVAAAFLSLRDEGLIRMFIEPEGIVLKSLNRIWVERTDLATRFDQMALVEGGLLMACEELAKKRFGKSDVPGVTAVITQFIRDSQDDVFGWVVGVARLQARQLGLYQPSSGRSAKPVYWFEHLRLRRPGRRLRVEVARLLGPRARARAGPAHGGAVRNPGPPVDLLMLDALPGVAKARGRFPGSRRPRSSPGRRPRS